MGQTAPSIWIVRAALMAMAAMALPACTVIPKGDIAGTTAPTSLPSAPPYVTPRPEPSPAPQPQPQPQPTPMPGMTAASIGVVAVASPFAVNPAIGNSTDAVPIFALSCPGLMKRTDASGLTQGGDWAEACAAAKTWPRGQSLAFFEQYFTPVRVADGRAFATGYYEPEIAGVRNRQSGFDVPIFGKPADLAEQTVNGTKLRGKMVDGQFVSYDSRADIENGSLSGRAAVIAWAANAPEVFFLQVQGSGRLRAPDGSIMRLNYAAGNGRPYTSIGKYMGERGLLAPGQATMQGIVAYLNANPAEGRQIMQVNESYVFFAESNTGPMGAMGYLVTPKMTVAADPKFVPLGAPIWMDMDRGEADGFWIAQDTGGAIKGANRFDTYWGAGDFAATTAGGMSARGQVVVLIPHVSARRMGLIP
jgi:membrane-bound lytic murein transglycosylase A